MHVERLDGYKTLLEAGHRWRGKSRTRFAKLLIRWNPSDSRARRAKTGERVTEKKNRWTGNHLAASLTYGA